MWEWGLVLIHKCFFQTEQRKGGTETTFTLFLLCRRSQEDEEIVKYARERFEKVRSDGDNTKDVLVMCETGGEGAFCATCDAGLTKRKQLRLRTRAYGSSL